LLTAVSGSDARAVPLYPLADDGAQIIVQAASRAAETQKSVTRIEQRAKNLKAKIARLKSDVTKRGGDCCGNVTTDVVFQWIADWLEGVDQAEQTADQMEQQLEQMQQEQEHVETEQQLQHMQEQVQQINQNLDQLDQQITNLENQL
jgi:peptidoglycan hydrolase CwlO-like protein